MYTCTNTMSICAYVFPKKTTVPDNANVNKRRDIKDVLSELTQRDKLTQTKLSEESGVPQPTISRILNGTHQTLELETVRRLADYFGISIDQLVGDEPLDNDRQWYAIKKVWQRIPDHQRVVVETTAKALAAPEERRTTTTSSNPQLRSGEINYKGQISKGRLINDRKKNDKKEEQ